MRHEVTGFEHLHRHGDNSLLDGYARVEEYAEYSKEVNQQYLCVTDHASMGVIPRQIRACNQHGLKPLFGVEAYFNSKQPTTRTEAEYKKYVDGCSEDDRDYLKKSYHLLAIAANDVGYSNLVKLTSWAYAYGYGGLPRRPRINAEQLALHSGGVIFTSGCYLGEIGQAFDRKGEEFAEEMLCRYIAQFGSNFYIEVMMLDFKKQKPYDAWLVKMHEKYHTPIIVSQDCFVAGTIVTTSQGVKQIEDIEIGDLVLTHKNKFMPVEHVNKRLVSDNESVYRVKALMGTYVWEVTGNHLVRVAQTKKKNQKKYVKDIVWKRVDELNERDFIVVPKIESSCLFNLEPLAYLDVMDYLTSDDYQLLGNVDISNKGNFSNRLTYDPDREVFVSYRRWDKISRIEVPRRIKITEDLLKIIGLYMAEGSSEKQGSLLGFGLHINEIEELQLVVRFFNQFSMVSNIRYVSDNGVSVRFSSSLFSKLFARLCGLGATGKHFPRICGKVFGVFSKEQIRTIIIQYWKGDGSFSSIRRKASVSSVSKIMIFELAHFLNAVGCFAMPSINERKRTRHKNKNANPIKWNNPWSLSYAGNRQVLLGNYLYLTDVCLDSNERGKRYLETKDAYFVKIDSVIPFKYNGSVYNLQVAGDETYVANLSHVHNCHYCKKEHSKYQRLMLMTRGKNTVHDIEKALAAGDSQEKYFELQDTQLWMKSEDELNEKWESDYQNIIPYEVFCEAKRNTVEVCRRAEGVKIDRSIKLPQIPDADEKLWEELKKGFKWRGVTGQKYVTQLRKEYDLICRKDFSSYFLITKMFCDEARCICPKILGWGSGDEAIAPGRGSAVGFLTCYLLGITGIDPLKHDLLAERFLSDARGGRQLILEFEQNDEMRH